MRSIRVTVGREAVQVMTPGSHHTDEVGVVDASD
jgi:hypothetical protein